MRFLVYFLVMTLMIPAYAAKDSELVDVDKNSKLSDYFQKINSKLSVDSEGKKLDLDKSAKVDLDRDEKDILLQEVKAEATDANKISPFQKMIFAVIGVLCLGVVALFGAKKMGGKVGHATIAKNITVLTQKSIGPKKNLMLIRVAGETILLGVTDHNINHLTTLSLMDDELPDFTEPQFSGQLKEKIAETQAFDEDTVDGPITNTQIEEVDGFAVSRLDDVKQAVTKRFSIS